VFKTIKWKIISSVFIIGTVGILSSLVFTYIQNLKMQEEAIVEARERLLKDITSRINKKKDIGQTNVLGFASNGHIIEALEKNDRELAFKELKKIGSFYKKNSNFKGIKAHVHTADGKSFVRSWKKEKFGEDLSFRSSIQYVRKTNKATVVLEVGKIGFMIRGISPILNANNEFIGSIEFLQGVGSVSRDFYNDGNRFILLLNEDVAKISPKVKRNKQIGGLYVANGKWFNYDTIEFADNINYSKLFRDGHYLTEDFFATFQEVKDTNNNVVGYYVVGEPIEKFEKNVDEILSVSYSFVALVIALMTLLIVILFVIVHYSFQPLTHLIELTKELSSGEGDLTKRLNCDEENCDDEKVNEYDEVGQVSLYINKFIDKVHDIVVKSKHTAIKNSEMSDHLITTSTRILTRVKQEATVIKEASDTWNKMEQRLFSTVLNLDSLKTQIDEANTSVYNAKADIFSMMKQLGDNAQAEKNLAGKLHGLKNEAQSTEAVLTAIATIADETNLLAINAAIEASHAGEKGKGFSVVADEVQKLSERTQEDLIKINRTINGIVEGINEASSEITKESEEMQHLIDISNRTEENMERTEVTMKKVVSISNNSTVVTNDVKSNASEMMGRIHEIFRLSKENVQNVDGMQVVFEELKKSTNELNELLNSFKTKEKEWEKASNR
jgi:methyl-accepting chemotaxis protein